VALLRLKEAGSREANTRRESARKLKASKIKLDAAQQETADIAVKFDAEVTEGHQKTTLLRSTHAEKAVALQQVGEMQRKEADSRRLSAQKLKAAVSRVQKSSEKALMALGSNSRSAIEMLPMYFAPRTPSHPPPPSSPCYIPLSLSLSLSPSPRAAVDAVRVKLDFETESAGKNKAAHARKAAALQKKLDAAEAEMGKTQEDIAHLLEEVDAQKEEQAETETAAADAVWEEEMTKKEVKVLAGLVGTCGKKGGQCSLEMAELGVELMSRGMTAPDARGVFIVFVKKAHPGLVLGKDYRVPDANQFKVFSAPPPPPPSPPPFPSTPSPRCLAS
jgi:DNA repair exonuclease SbcCD ATPase subunit